MATATSTSTATKIDPDVQLADALGNFLPAYRRWLRSMSSDRGITYRQLRVLSVLQRDGSQIMNDISDRVTTSPRNVTDIVDALEKEDLVRRTTHPSDRRAILIELTEKGASMYLETQQQYIASASLLFSGLPESDQRELLRILGTLQEQLERRGITACKPHGVP